MSASQAAPAGARLAVVIADGLRADVAEQVMGHVWALVEAGRARATRHACPLPGLSRPLYATLLTGRLPVDHGIVTNEAVQACTATWLHDAHAEGFRSGVVAYHWFYELLSGERFDPLLHREAVPTGAGIAGARWYFEDTYPDSHAVADAEALRRLHQPDLLLVHPMGPDDAGHRHGGESEAYRLCARRLDAVLAHVLPLWHAAGYDVLLTSDHGMGRDRMHGGAETSERVVPFVWMPHTGRPAAALEAQLALPLPEGTTGLRDFIRRQRQLARQQAHGG